MLTIEQQREQMDLIEEMKWDRTYKLPDYVDEYLKMIKKMLPTTIEVRPWTQMRYVSFFHDGEYLTSLDYMVIEDIMDRIQKKAPWYTKFWRKKCK